MPGPFDRPDPVADPDRIAESLERGARARQLLSLGVSDDLTRRRDAVLRQAEMELRAGTLTPDRAIMHLACCNALDRYREELNEDVQRAQRAADLLHAEVALEPGDGDE